LATLGGEPQDDERFSVCRIVSDGPALEGEDVKGDNVHQWNHKEDGPQWGVASAFEDSEDGNEDDDNPEKKSEPEADAEEGMNIE
jgi:hypothetical protein